MMLDPFCTFSKLVLEKLVAHAVSRTVCCVHTSLPSLPPSKMQALRTVGSLTSRRFAAVVPRVARGAAVRHTSALNFPTEEVGAGRPALLFTPGPLTTSAAVKDAMTRDLGTRDSVVMNLIKDCRNGILQVAGLSQVCAVPRSAHTPGSLAKPHAVLRVCGTGGRLRERDCAGFWNDGCGGDPGLRYPSRRCQGADR